MAPQAGTTNTPDPTSGPAGYQVDDLTIDLGPRRVRRAGTAIPLKALSFDLLVALVRAAPGLLSFDELSERVWPGLVVTPETIVQRVKLLRSALGDDPQAPRYIEGVRGRGYRMVAQVRPIAVQAGVPATQAAAVSSRARPGKRLSSAWIGGTLAIVMLLAASWAVIQYGGVRRPAERTSPGAAAASIHSLAVLPLENLSGDKEQEYFAEGMTDALTTDLAQIGSLRVISRTSAMQFKGSRETLPQIGRDLQVEAVVEGTVTRGGNRVRVTAQLIEASGDRHLWARSYERDLKDVLALQDEIAQDISEQIRVKVSPRERSLLIQTPAIDPEAYDDYLRGSYWMSQLSPEGHKKGCEYIQKTIAKDPGYAPAYVAVAVCGDSPDSVRKAIAKALALDPSLASAHTWLATLKCAGDWDWAGAEAEYKRAIVLNPSSAPAHRWYSAYLVAMGRIEEATREIELAQDLDPYSADIVEWRGQVLYHARRYDDALREMRRGLEMHPDSPAFYSDMADVYEQKKMFAEAFAARQQGLSLLKDPKVAALAEAYQHSGYRGYLLKQAELADCDCPQYSGHIYALLNDEPRAIAAMEVAYKEHQVGMLFIRTAPELDSIRSSPRYRDLVRRMAFPPSPGEVN